MRAKVNARRGSINAVANAISNAEHRQLIHACGALRPGPQAPSPLRGGREPSSCAVVGQSIGMAPETDPPLRPAIPTAEQRSLTPGAGMPRPSARMEQDLHRCRKHLREKS